MRGGMSRERFSEETVLLIMRESKSRRGFSEEKFCLVMLKSKSRKGFSKEMFCLVMLKSKSRVWLVMHECKSRDIFVIRVCIKKLQMSRVKLMKRTVVSVLV
jgi:hypothetical protein